MNWAEAATFFVMQMVAYAVILGLAKRVRQLERHQHSYLKVGPPVDIEDKVIEVYKSMGWLPKDTEGWTDKQLKEWLAKVRLEEEVE